MSISLQALIDKPFLNKQWAKVFPVNVTRNYTSSVVFMKQLTTIAISTITYLKHMFPENNFTIDTYAELNLKILKRHCVDQTAQFMSDCLQNSFESFDKKYLHQLVLCFYKDEEHSEENLIEYFSFEYSYNQEGIVITCQSQNRNEKKVTNISFEDVQKTTAGMVRKINVFMSSTVQLPDSYDFIIRLFYNDDAPDGYQPPGFESAKNYDDILTHTVNDRMTYGHVVTPYHELVAQYYCKDSNDDVPTQIVQPIERGEMYTINCPCKNYKDLDDGREPLLIKCMYCEMWQHSACFGLREFQVSDITQHCCSDCYDEDNTRVCTDPILARRNDEKRKNTCIFRRILQECTKMETINESYLIEDFGIDEETASRMITMLEKYNVLKKAGNIGITTPRGIHLEALEKLINNTFQTRMYLANELLVELHSQQYIEADDPIGHVLSTMEKDSLQNTSQIGRVIENTNRILQKADDTMKQFRDVIMKDPESVSEELPLSGSHNPVKITKKISLALKRNKSKANDHSGVSKKKKTSAE